jgi:hypothetical protein
VQDLWQLFTRPTIQLVPYATPDKSVFICSSSTPPGGGVHGMSGYFAAQTALRGGLQMLLAPLTSPSGSGGISAHEPSPSPTTGAAGAGHRRP